MMTTMMKRWIALTMSAALALSITACGSSKPAASQSGSASDTSAVLGENTQIPNPWQDFESLEEAVKAVGFDFAVPDALAGCDKVAYQAIPDDQIIGVLYLNGEERQVSIRKALGAQESTILTQFVVEAGVTSALGGCLGIVLGYVVSAIINQILPYILTDITLNVTPSADAAAIAVGISCGIGVLFGFLPARRAARRASTCCSNFSCVTGQQMTTNSSPPMRQASPGNTSFSASATRQIRASPAA